MERYKNKKGIRYKGYRMMQAVIWVTSTVWIMVISSCAYHSPDEDWEKNGKVRLLLRKQNSGCPDNMTWYFYPEDSESPLMRTGDVSGYEGTLPLGRYRVAVCNTGCTGVTLEMEKGYEEACGRAPAPYRSPVRVACTVRVWSRSR